MSYSLLTWICLVVDVNECVEVPEVCGGSDAGVCTNTDGGYVCTCRNGFVLNDNNVCIGKLFNNVITFDYTYRRVKFE